MNLIAPKYWPFSKMLTSLGDQLYHIAPNWPLVFLFIVVGLRLVTYGFSKLFSNYHRSVAELEQLVTAKLITPQEQRARQDVYIKRYGSSAMVGSIGVFAAYVALATLLQISRVNKEIFSAYSFLWIKDLTTPDPYGVLTIIYAAILLSSMPKSTDALTSRVFSPSYLMYWLIIFAMSQADAYLVIYFIISFALSKALNLLGKTN